MIMLPRTAPSAPAPKRRTRSIWATTAVCLSCAASLPSAVFGQAALPPWISSMPGLEHPAAWAMGEHPLQMGLQQDSRWNGDGQPLMGLWAGAGWQPEAKGGYNRRGPDPLSFGISFKEDPLSTGWRERSLSISAAASASINRDWKAHAGLSVGASAWRLDPASWSWNAQYGPGGFDPQAPTGEEQVDGANGGSRLDVAISLGVSPTRAARRNGKAVFQGAATLHHLSSGKAPHLSPAAGDSIRWRPAWWLEGQGSLDWEKFEWRAWHRGTVQAQSHLLEWGMAVGRPFGTTARFTKTQLSHHIETGLLWRSDGLLRLILGWERNGLRLNTGPAWTVGRLWRPAAGWSLGLTWSPDMQSTVSLQR